MKTSISQIKYPGSKTLSALLFLFGIMSVAPVVFAVPVPSGTNERSKESIALPEQPLETPFVYEIERRADPFMPFISEKAASANINEILPVDEQLSGMQLFEPGQLNLVAIVMAGDSDFAMAEDTTGKGYILHAGMKIGKRGIITAIKANEVTIEETAFTRAGKKLTSKVVMLLKKEGEE
jgi:type IV pilus assembly protein PilP